MYEHAAARRLQVHRYMAFYLPESEYPISIDIQVAGNNRYAMTAEPAFQFGMSHWDTECCSEQAVAYLAYAYRLFPRSETYRKTYRKMRVTLALEKFN